MRHVFDSALRATMTGHLAALDRVAVAAGGLVHAAVAVCVISGNDGEACFVLTRRAAGLRSHARQWALPGGRVDGGEEAEDAALREATEEVGLRASRADILGVLDDYRTRSGYVMTPVVIWCGDDATSLVANEDEVESIHLIPLTDLESPEAPRLLNIPESEAPVIQMPAGGEWIHAPTAAVLLQLRDVGLHGLSTRVGHFEQPTWAWR